MVAERTYIIQGITIDSLSGTNDQIGRRSIHAVSCDDHLATWLEDGFDRGFAFNLVDSEDCAAEIVQQGR